MASLQHTIEELHHFSCISCSKWWTIGDALVDKNEWFCPWCGEKNNYEKRISRN